MFQSTSLNKLISTFDDHQNITKEFAKSQTKSKIKSKLNYEKIVIILFFKLLIVLQNGQTKKTIQQFM